MDDTDLLLENLPLRVQSLARELVFLRARVELLEEWKAEHELTDGELADRYVGDIDPTCKS